MTDFTSSTRILECELGIYISLQAKAFTIQHLISALIQCTNQSAWVQLQISTRSLATPPFLSHTASSNPTYFPRSIGREGLHLSTRIEVKGTSQRHQSLLHRCSNKHRKYSSIRGGTSQHFKRRQLFKRRYGRPKCEAQG